MHMGRSRPSMNTNIVRNKVINHHSAIIGGYMSKTCINCLAEYDEQFDICPKCGFCESSSQPDEKCLKVGTCLENRYVIGVVEFISSVAICYSGYDDLSRHKILISEYFTKDIVRREYDDHLGVISPKSELSFMNQIKKIYSTAEKQAKFCHLTPIMKIIDIIQENGTVYLVYNRESGKTLAKDLKDREYDQVVVNEILRKVIEAVKMLHDYKLFHGNISPDSIYITDKGVIKLINFTFGLPKVTTPEHLLKSSSSDIDSDINAMIILFYTLNSASIPPNLILHQSRSNFQVKRKQSISLSDFETALTNAGTAVVNKRMNYVDKFTKEINRITLTHYRILLSNKLRLILIVIILITAIGVTVFSVIRFGNKKYATESNPAITSSSYREFVFKSSDFLLK